MAKEPKKFLVLRTCMMKKGLTQKDVGKLLGLKSAAVSKRLSGKTPWTINELLRLKKEFEKTIEELLV